jgi:hypothetical protein
MKLPAAAIAAAFVCGILARLEELSRTKKIPVEHELRGQTFACDGAKGKFFWPAAPPTEETPLPKNSDSLVPAPSLWQQNRAPAR